MINKALSLLLAQTRAYHRGLTKISMLSFLTYLFFISPMRGQSTPNVEEFKFTSNGDVLAGEISFPKHVENPPLLVFLPGSGNSSYHTNYKWYLDATLYKVAKGRYAILNFDKPGIGMSGGSWWHMDFHALAKNAIDAIRYAKKNFSIDTTKIGVIGHSQGGWLVQIICSDYANEIQFGISQAGAVTTVFEQDVQNENSKLRCKGLDSIQAMNQAILNVYKQYTSPLEPLDKKNDLHYKIIKGYDPSRVIRHIEKPLLFLFGENDPLVYAKNSVERLNEIFAHNIPTYIQWSIIKGTDHSLYRKRDFCFEGDSSTLPVSEELNAVMSDFIMRQFTKYPSSN